MAPTIINPKLNDCCVVLATFSAGDNMPQGTLPLSLNGVTVFLLGCGCALDAPSPVCVAYSRAVTRGLMLAGRCASVGDLAADNISTYLFFDF
jgi:hypothetical protein